MNRLSTVARAIGFAVTLLLVSIAAPKTSRAEEAVLGFGTQVWLTDLESQRFVTTFVPTDSASPVVLCTLNENSPGYGAVRLSGITLLCRQRSANFGEGDVTGVAVLAILPPTFQFNGNASIGLAVSVVQLGASEYGDQRSCEGQCW
jgi:hypothetical protein